MSQGICFLDFDGVMNGERVENTQFPHRPPSHRDPVSLGAHDLATELVQNVRHVVNQHQLEVVVSSTWRQSFSVASLEAILHMHGWHDLQIRGATPKLARHLDEPLRMSEYLSYRGLEKCDRGLEIEIWLRQNFVQPVGIPILILDDLNNFGRMAPWLHQTDPDTGFVDRAVGPKPLDESFRAMDPLILQHCSNLLSTFLSTAF